MWGLLCSQLQQEKSSTFHLYYYIDPVYANMFLGFWELNLYGLLKLLDILGHNHFLTTC